MSTRNKTRHAYAHLTILTTCDSAVVKSSTQRSSQLSVASRAEAGGQEVAHAQRDKVQETEQHKYQAIVQREGEAIDV